MKLYSEFCSTKAYLAYEVYLLAYFLLSSTTKTFKSNKLFTNF